MSRITAEQLWAMSRAELRQTLAAGHPIDPVALDNQAYRGVSLGLPAFMDKLAWKTFSKTFYRDPETGVLRGWNVRMEQTGTSGAFTPMMSGDQQKTFGHYHVVDPAGHTMPSGANKGLLIHYGLGGNPWYDIMRRIRDPLVAVNAGDTELLLGWSYLDLGFAAWGTPSWFTLQREQALDHVAHP
jgi:hypothetical protein